jgi:glutamate/tyrosine decarboxylase-like PLP-dependent enzyme
MSTHFESTEVLLRRACDLAVGYLRELPARSVPPSAAAIDDLKGFAEPLPDGESDPKVVLEMLNRLGSPATMAMAGPRFFGFVIGGSLPVAVGAQWLASAWDQNTGLWSPTPATATLEEVALKWLVDLFGLPAGTGGGFVTGATVANFAALAAARNGVLKAKGWEVERDGLFGAPPVRVVVGAEAHPTLTKSLGMLGLGRNRVERVPVDGQGRMRTEALPPLDATTIVCAQVGNVNTGAVDPVGEIANRCASAGAWLHVDGAFGLWARAVPSRAGLLAGIERADSWATDAHKSLNVPYDCGLAFVKRPETLRAAMAISAEYLPTESGRRNPSDYTPELSRRARGVEVWAAMRMLGRRGLARMIETTYDLAQRFADGLRAKGYEILNEVVLNQVLVSFGSTELTHRVVAAVQADGTCWCGPTVWQGRAAMRISVSSWATTAEDVDRSLAAIHDCASRCSASA